MRSARARPVAIRSPEGAKSHRWPAAAFSRSAAPVCTAGVSGVVGDFEECAPWRYERGLLNFVGISVRESVSGEMSGEKGASVRLTEA